MAPAKTLADLQDQIRENYGDLSKRLRQVAEYVINNHNSVAFDTIAIISEKAEVPPSTLIRFAKDLGFSGFNEMKQLFKDKIISETGSYTERARLVSADADGASIEQPSDILTEFARANAQAMTQLAVQTPAENLERTVDILTEADTIYVIGMGRSFSAAAYLVYALHHMERRVVLIDGLGGMYREQYSAIGKSDAVISISFSPYAEETQRVNKAASDAGARQIVVTDSQISPLATLSDVTFVVKEAQIDSFRSQCATHCLIQSIAVSLTFRISKQSGT